MCGTNSVGTTPTIATNATPLSGGGASTTTTSVAGQTGSGIAMPAVPAAASPLFGGGPAGLDSLAPILSHVAAAIEALKQALAGGGLVGGGGPMQMPMQCSGMQAPALPEQLPPAPTPAQEEPGTGGADGGGEQKADKPKKGKDKPAPKGNDGAPAPKDPAPKDPAPKDPAPPTGGGGGADAAPPTNNTPSQSQLISAYKEKYFAWEALYTQRKALSAEIADLKRQRDQYTSGGPDAMARNRLTQQINAKQKIYDDGFAAINRALIARNDAFRAAGLPRAIHPNELP